MNKKNWLLRNQLKYNVCTIGNEWGAPPRTNPLLRGLKCQAKLCSPEQFSEPPRFPSPQTYRVLWAALLPNTAELRISPIIPKPSSTLPSLRKLPGMATSGSLHCISLGKVMGSSNRVHTAAYFFTLFSLTNPSAHFTLMTRK